MRFSDNGSSNWYSVAKTYSEFLSEYVREFKVVKIEDLNLFVTLSLEQNDVDQLLELNEYVIIIYIVILF